MKNLVNYQQFVNEAKAKRRFVLNDETLAELRSQRHKWRIENRGGGACHLMSDYIQDEYGFKRKSGTYTTISGDVICADGHLWNVLPDGSILDTTCDQFGEEQDIQLIKPTDPNHARYREAYLSYCHPGHKDYPDFKDDKWDGKMDDLEEKRLNRKLGKNWWVKSPDAFKKYSEENKLYKRGFYKHDNEDDSEEDDFEKHMRSLFGK